MQENRSCTRRCIDLHSTRFPCARRASNEAQRIDSNSSTDATIAAHSWLDSDLCEAMRNLAAAWIQSVFASLVVSDVAMRGVVCRLQRAERHNSLR